METTFELEIPMQRRTLIAAAIASLVSVRALAQAKHWLVGTWKGEIGGSFNSRDGAARTMIIAEAAPGGEVKGSWSATGKPRIGNADFKLAGDRLSVTTTADSLIEMTRVADNRLRGQMRVMKSGKTYPIELVRE